MNRKPKLRSSLVFLISCFRIDSLRYDSEKGRSGPAAWVQQLVSSSCSPGVGSLFWITAPVASRLQQHHHLHQYHCHHHLHQYHHPHHWAGGAADGSQICPLRLTLSLSTHKRGIYHNRIVYTTIPQKYSLYITILPIQVLFYRQYQSLHWSGLPFSHSQSPGGNVP